MSSAKATSEEIRRVRQALGEDQPAFGARFGVTRRTVIRWEKAGHIFRWWGGWLREDGKSDKELWLDAVKDSFRASSKVKVARRRLSALKKNRAVKRRRGSAARRRPVVKGKTGRARR